MTDEELKDYKLTEKFLLEHGEEIMKLWKFDNKKEELSMIGSLSEEEARLEAEIKSKKLLLRLVKEQQVCEVRDLVERNADVLRLLRATKKCYEKDCGGEAAGSLCSLLEEMLDCKQVLLTKVVQCGSIAYAWAISFRKLGKKNIDFVLEVPEADGINADYFDEANRGKFVLYRDNGSSHELIVQSYDFNIVKEAFKDEVKNGIQLRQDSCSICKRHCKKQVC